MDIEFVLFDLYGTLVDIEVDEGAQDFWDALARHLADQDVHTDPERLHSLFSSLLHEELSRLPDGFVMENVLCRMLRAVGVETSHEIVKQFGSTFRSLSTKRLSLRPYTPALLEAVFASGVKTGIVSNTEGILTRTDISRFPILEHIDVIVLSSEVGLKKPDSRIFGIAMERLQAYAAKGIFVGDNLKEDVIGALDAHLRCIYLRNNGNPLDVTLAKSPVVEATPDLDSILNALRTLGWKGNPGAG